MDRITQDMVNVANATGGRDAARQRRMWVLGLLTLEEYVIEVLTIRTARHPLTLGNW